MEKTKLKIGDIVWKKEFFGIKTSLVVKVSEDGCHMFIGSFLWQSEHDILSYCSLVKTTNWNLF